MKLNKGNKRGISLIVLVITIIVMIILAAAIILSLNSSGIIGKANKAKEESDMSNIREAALVSATEYELKANLEGTYSQEGMLEYVKNDLKDDFEEKDLNKIVINTSGGIGLIGIDSYYYIDETVTEEGRNNKVLIPSGFILSDIPSEKTIDGGLVIYEGSDPVTLENAYESQTTRNQFVWVPVDNYALFERTTTYDGTITPPSIEYVEPATCVSSASTNGSEVILSATNDLTGEYAEYAAMRSSVQKNKGFYIGRYEAGTTKRSNYTTEVFVQKNKPIYNYVGWGASMIDVESDVVDRHENKFGKGAVKLSRDLYKDNKAVVSTLSYGVQWDAMLQFIYKTDSTFISKKKNNGWYYSSNQNLWYPNYKTGVDLGENAANRINNIYDIAGYIGEWTMETYDTRLLENSNFNYSFRRMIRGRNWGNKDRDNVECSYRVVANFDEFSHYIGFRVALYIK